MTRKPYLEVARHVLTHRYPDAEFAFVAGSISRGDATESSDIDLVVLFPKLECAYRESFIADGWPVEAFVHDFETVAYFFDRVDAPSSRPALAHMVSEGIAIPGPSPQADEVRGRAQAVLVAGPKPLDEEARNAMRYSITDLVDDLRTPRDEDETLAVLTELYGSLSEYLLRMDGHWTGRGKSIPRALRRRLPNRWEEFRTVFRDAFRERKGDAVIAFAEKALASQGGFLFAGYRCEAPAEWRTPVGSAESNSRD